MSDRFWRQLDAALGFMGLFVFFSMAVFLANIEIKDLDLWLHLGMGEYILQHGYVPGMDVLSHTIEGKPWINHEWLFQIIAYVLQSTYGFFALSTMQVVLVAASLALLLLLVYRSDRQLLIIPLLLLVLLEFKTRFTIRPELFSLLFFVVYMHILSFYLDRRWSVIAVFVIQVLWSNMHGFFFMGPLLVLLMLGGELIKAYVPLPFGWSRVGRLSSEELKRLGLILTTALLACLVNPLTFKGAWYPVWVLVSLPAESKVFFENIYELQRPITAANWADLGQYSHYKALILISGVSFVFNRKNFDITAFILWIVFLLFSLAAIRNLTFFAFVAVMVTMVNSMDVKLSQICPIRFEGEKFARLTQIFLKLILIFVLLNVWMGFADRGYYDFDAYARKSEYGGVSLREYPHKAAEFVREQKISGNFFNDFNSGAYLIGHVYPRVKVYIDGRTELYGADFFRRYKNILDDGNMEAFSEDVERYDITGVFLTSATQPIQPAFLRGLWEDPEWVPVYFNYDGVVFLKDDPRNRVWIDNFALDLEQWRAEPENLQKLGAARLEPYRQYNRAFSLESMGLYAAALSEVEEALRVYPGHFGSWELKGKLHARLENYEEAFEHLRVAAMLNPTDAKTRLNFGISYEYIGNLEGAAEQYERLIEVAPTHPKGYFKMASVQAKLGHARPSIDFLTHALSLDPAAIGDTLAIGDIFFEQQNYEAAMAVYQLARQYADGPQIFYKLGQAALQYEGPAEAVAYYEEGLRRHPEDADLKLAVEEARNF